MDYFPVNFSQNPAIQVLPGLFYYTLKQIVMSKQLIYKQTRIEGIDIERGFKRQSSSTVSKEYTNTICGRQKRENKMRHARTIGFAALFGNTLLDVIATNTCKKIQHGKVVGRRVKSF